jgi:hypothetical protein
VLPRVSTVSSIGRGNVTFCSRVTVRYLIDWSPETYRAARKGPWLRLAAERRKFDSKIRVFEGQ